MWHLQGPFLDNPDGHLVKQVFVGALGFTTNTLTLLLLLTYCGKITFMGKYRGKEVVNRHL